MSEVVLFHHAQGLTPGVLALAERLRAPGHTVHTPDLYDGRTFQTLDAGLAYLNDLGDAVDARADAALAEYAGSARSAGSAGGLTLIGVSLGVMPAQRHAQTSPGVDAAVLIGSCVDPTYFAPTWPAGVPVQVHGMDADPIFVEDGDLAAAQQLVEQAPQAELFLYPGDQHLFIDSSLDSFVPDAAALLTERVLAFLSR